MDIVLPAVHVWRHNPWERRIEMGHIADKRKTTHHVQCDNASTGTKATGVDVTAKRIKSI